MDTAMSKEKRIWLLILTSFEMLDANDLHPNNGYVELW